MAEHRYDPSQIEPRWQRVWADEHTWEVSNDAGDPRPKSYVLVMLPYPSGEPHIGHLKVYSVGDPVLPCLRPPGAIAQLGERLHGMQEVGGSSPPSSITESPY